MTGAPCGPCAALRQYVENWVLWTDLTANTFLGGNPRETMSRRIARARACGERWATLACAVLTWCAHRITGSTLDHCAWSLAPGGSIASEVWHWSPATPEDQDGLPDLLARAVRAGAIASAPPASLTEPTVETFVDVMNQLHRDVMERIAKTCPVAGSAPVSFTDPEAPPPCPS